MRYDKVEITRRDALAGGLGAGALLALAACGAGGTSSNNSSVSASPPSSEANFYKRAGSKAGTKSISVLAADAPQTNAIKALVGQFEQLTGISVRWTALAETAEQSKLNVSLGSGAASYDVIYGSSVETSNYITRNWLASIDTLAHNKDVTSPKWSKKPYGTTSLAQLSQHNTLYGVPWFAGTQVLWYRTDIFKDHGITAPPKTFADLENICKKIHSSSTAAIALRTASADPVDVLLDSMAVCVRRQVLQELRQREVLGCGPGQPAGGPSVGALLDPGPQVRADWVH
jgi:ABC-type glycerol-3-phosphate transport system substrate-binding protein